MAPAHRDRAEQEAMTDERLDDPLGSFLETREGHRPGGDA
jgi:hypothetical protein